MAIPTPSGQPLPPQTTQPKTSTPVIPVPGAPKLLPGVPTPPKYVAPTPTPKPVSFPIYAPGTTIIPGATPSETVVRTTLRPGESATQYFTPTPSGATFHQTITPAAKTPGIQPVPIEAQYKGGLFTTAEQKRGIESFFSKLYEGAFGWTGLRQALQKEDILAPNIIYAVPGTPQYQQAIQMGYVPETPATRAVRPSEITLGLLSIPQSFMVGGGLSTIGRGLEALPLASKAFTLGTAVSGGAIVGKTVAETQAIKSPLAQRFQYFNLLGQIGSGMAGGLTGGRAIRFPSYPSTEPMTPIVRPSTYPKITEISAKPEPLAPEPSEPIALQPIRTTAIGQIEGVPVKTITSEELPPLQKFPTEWEQIKSEYTPKGMRYILSEFKKQTPIKPFETPTLVETEVPNLYFRSEAIKPLSPFRRFLVSEETSQPVSPFKVSERFMRFVESKETTQPITPFKVEATPWLSRFISEETSATGFRGLERLRLSDRFKEFVQDTRGIQELKPEITVRRPLSETISEGQRAFEREKMISRLQPQIQFPTLFPLIGQITTTVQKPIQPPITVVKPIETTLDITIPKTDTIQVALVIPRERQEQITIPIQPQITPLIQKPVQNIQSRQETEDRFWTPWVFVPPSTRREKQFQIIPPRQRRMYQQIKMEREFNIPEFETRPKAKKIFQSAPVHYAPRIQTSFKPSKKITTGFYKIKQVQI